MLKPLKNNTPGVRGQQRQSSLIYWEKQIPSQGQLNHPKSRYHFPYTVLALNKNLDVLEDNTCQVIENWRKQVIQILEILDFKLLIYSRQ